MLTVMRVLELCTHPGPRVQRAVFDGSDDQVLSHRAGRQHSAPNIITSTTSTSTFITSTTSISLLGRWHCRDVDIFSHCLIAACNRKVV